MLDYNGVSPSVFATWCRNNTHNIDTYRIPIEHGELLSRLSLWNKSRILTKVNNNPEKYDSYVATHFLLNDVFDVPHLQPKIWKWLPPSSFTNIANTLTSGNDFISANRLCHLCGEKCSWQHCFINCAATPINQKGHISLCVTKAHV